MPNRRLLLSRALAVAASAAFGMGVGKRVAAEAAPGADGKVDTDDDANRARFHADTTLEVGGGSIGVAFRGALPVPRQTILEALTAGAEAVSTYYGRFPLPRVRIGVNGTGGRSLHGATYGRKGDGAYIHLRVGAGMTASNLRESWVIAHELVHLAFPDQRGKHRWMEEGLASYVEPIARAQVGALAEDVVWRDFVDGMPQGLPKRGDRGLDGTPTWGRTYWGGALFCLLADIEIRSRTDNRVGLQHALRGIQAAGGSIAAHWPLAQALAAGDAAIGLPVLAEQYKAMRAKPVDVDLPALWRRLGVVVDGKTVTFDDAAPAAATRRAITDRTQPATTAPVT